MVLSPLTNPRVKFIMIDVCIATLKGRKEVEPVIKSLRDSGVQINKIILSKAKTRALARTELISKATTEWFIMIDDDIIVNSNWYHGLTIACFECEDDVATISGLGLSDSQILNAIRYFLIWLRGTNKQRLFTSNTLIRKSAVKGIKLDVPNETHNEDFQLQQEINKRGYKCIALPNAVCFHTKPGKKVWADAFSDFKRITRQEGLITAIRKI